MIVVSLEDRLHAARLRSPLSASAEMSEDAIALAFTAKHGGTLRFDHQMGHWFQWDGTRWRKDETELAFDLAREVARSLAEGKRTLGRAATAAGVEKLAKADRSHAVESSIWDG